MNKQKQLVSQMHIKAVGDTGAIEGYLNTFNYQDHAGDITLAGAFDRTLRELKAKGRPLPMLWTHEHDSPIGIWKELSVDAKGLYAVGEINLDTQQGREAYSLVKQGALSGISIGYFVMDEDYDRPNGINYLKDIELIEASLCVFPCNETSRIEAVKKKMKQNKLPSKRELEAVLKTAGLSNSEAKAICSKYLPDYVDAEEKARLADEAKAQVEALITEHGLGFKAVDPLNDTPEEVTTVPSNLKEEEEEDLETKEPMTDDPKKPDGEEEEKANPFDAFFK